MAEGDEVTFLEQLKISHLVSSEEVRKASGRLASGVSATNVVRGLVDEKRLTSWQGQMLLSGQKTSFFLGKYKLLSLLGQGGMGAVFKAEQIPLGRIVALKVMAAGLVKDQAAVARFHREIQAAAALEHPNVVTTFDADHVDQTTFLVMEYLDGESLNEVLERCGRIPPATACEYIRQAALGLQHAHERGMAHRDIKPSNLLLTQTAEGVPLVKILDMGLARFTGGDCDSGELTKTGQVMGTPDYIAPEQAMRTKDADIRSDIYSLGCTLFRMLTGVVPFSGDNVMEKLMARAMNEAPLVRKHCPELSAELEAVVARMLAREPSLRYQTPLEVAKALEKFASTPFDRGTQVAHRARERQPIGVQVRLNPYPVDLSAQAQDFETAETIDHTPPVVGGETVLMEPSSPSARPRDSRPATSWLVQRRQAERRKLAVGVPLVAVALVAIACAWLWHSWGATSLVLDWPEGERTKAQLKVDGLEYYVPTKGEISIPKARQGKRNVHLAREGFKNIDLELEFSRGETKTVRPEWVPTAKTVRGQHLAEFRAEVDSWQKKSEAAAFTESERKKWTARYQTLRANFMGTMDLPVLEALWRKLPSLADQLSTTQIPSEARLVFEMLMDAGEFPAELVSIWGDGQMRAPDLNVPFLAVQPQGQLAVTYGGYQSIVWDLPTGRPWMRPLTGAACAFSQDGEYFALAYTDVEVWSVKNKQIEYTVHSPKPTGAIRSMAFVPGTRWLAITGEGPDVVVWDLEQNALHSRMTVPDEPVRLDCVAASFDGQWLAAGGASGELQLWNLKTGMSRTLARDQPVVVSLAFRRDGQVLASGTLGQIHLWDVATGNLRQTIHRGQYGVHTISWNAAGTIIAANKGDSSFQLWNPEDGTLIQTLSSRGRGNMLGYYTNDDRIVTCTGEGEIEIWTGPEWKSDQQREAKVQCAAVDPLGEWVAVATLDQEIQLRRIDGGEVLRRWKSREIPVAIAIRPDGQRLAVRFGTSTERTMQVLDVSSEEAPQTIDCETILEALAYSPDGRLLVGGSSQGITVWDALSLKRRAQSSLPGAVGYGPPVMAISADSQRLVLAGALGPTAHEFCLFALPKGEPLFHGPAPGASSATRLSDPQFVLLGDNISRLHRLDLVTRQFRAVELINAPHNLSWISLAMLPQGGAVASGMDGKLRVVDQQTRHITREIDLGGFCNFARQVLSTPDGRHLVLVMPNGTVAILRIPPD